MPTVHLLIKGKVQGVFYRATAKETATRSGLTGWVRNTDEGHVEAMVNGAEEAIQQFINWCRNGPEEAVVTEVVITEKEEQPFSKFTIKRG